MSAEAHALYDPATGIIRQTGRGERFVVDALAAQLGLAVCYAEIAEQRTTRIVAGQPVAMDPVTASVDTASGAAPLAAHLVCAHPGFVVLARGEIDPEMPEWAWDQRWQAVSLLELTPPETAVTVTDEGLYVLYVAVSAYSATRLALEVTA